MAGARVDPIGASSFYLEVPGYDKVGSFQEISGIESETEVRELVQSTKDGKSVTIKTQGAATLKPGKLTVKYAAFKDDPMLKWRQMVVEGKMNDARKNITLTAYDVLDKAVMKFNFSAAWPSKYAYSSFSAKSNDAVSVTLTIEHEGIEIK